MILVHLNITNYNYESISQRFGSLFEFSNQSQLPRPLGHDLLPQMNHYKNEPGMTIMPDKKSMILRRERTSTQSYCYRNNGLMLRINIQGNRGFLHQNLRRFGVSCKMSLRPILGYIVNLGTDTLLFCILCWLGLVCNKMYHRLWQKD